jgi:hypothetical protein
MNTKVVMRKKKITPTQYADAMTSVRLSSHEKVCMERMKTLIKSIDELKKDVKEMRADMNKWKGAGGIILILISIIGSVFYFFTK